MIDAYSSDVALMQQLGLRVEDFDREWNDLGTVPVHDIATVRVEVSAMPAQFWRFTVTRWTDGERETRIVETGSGAFVDYWPTVKLVAQGMLEIT